MILLAESESLDDRADARSDLGLRCPHMPEDTFSHVETHIINTGLHHSGGILFFFIFLFYFFFHLSAVCIYFLVIREWKLGTEPILC